MYDILSALVLFLGLYALVYPLYLSREFQGTTGLGKAIQLVLISTSIAMLCTLLFGLAAKFHWLESLSGNVQNLLRCIIFTSSVIPCQYLTYKFKELHATNKE